MSSFLEASICPLCGNSRGHLFLSRESVPVHQNLLCRDKSAARAITRGELRMVACETCGFVFNAAFREDKLEYGESYDNTQDCSFVFAAHLDEQARYLVQERGLRDSLVLEVGCGNGAFLRRLVDHPGAGNRGIGFDPSYTGPETRSDGRLEFRREFFSPVNAPRNVDAVVCRHVIEHVAQPLELLRTVRAALVNSPDARVYFETPCVEWILANHVIWDFFYEHCSLFSRQSLAAAFAATGFRVDAVHHLFGGQYLWLEAGLASSSAAPAWSAGKVLALARAFALDEPARRTRWLHSVRTLAGEGRLALWGAGAKGATFANLVDPDATWIDCIVDLNPAKQGRFVPGSGHPIVSPAELASRGVRNAILMNPNYREENALLLKESGIETTLVELA